MKRAIYYRLIILAFAAVLICSLTSAMLYAYYSKNLTERWLIDLTLSTAANYEHEKDVNALSESAGNNRVTIIAPDGTVLADSDADVTIMINHSNREEVKFAKAGSVYTVIRSSYTLGEKFMYAAIETEDGTILRLAHSYPGLLYNFGLQVPAILISIMAALLLSLFLAVRFTKTVTNPLEKMVDALSIHEYAKLRDHKSPYYEIDKVMHTLQELLQKITDSKMKLENEREKVDYILSNMAEGFVLVDSKKNILHCNSSARRFLSCSSSTKLENIYNLTRNKKINNAIQSAIDHEQSSVFDVKLSKKLSVKVYISPSKIEKSKLGVTMLIMDISAEEQLKQQKRDFFSNASHELKTPITSIIGFSEMLNQNIVKDEQKKTHIMERIETEAKRMSGLINDILTISKLETNNVNKEYAEFKFDDVIKEAVNAVSPMKDSTIIEINMDLDDVLIRADKHQMYDLCVNLIENAVKYNKPEGKVDISLKTQEQNVIFTVKDTGIGIPIEYHKRVFERFFRIDQGRDKKVGGTGLGLSIVKHIVSLYEGKISLQSKKNSGTEIVVTLPGTVR